MNRPAFTDGATVESHAKQCTHCLYVDRRQLHAAWHFFFKQKFIVKMNKCKNVTEWQTEVIVFGRLWGHMMSKGTGFACVSQRACNLSISSFAIHVAMKQYVRIVIGKRFWLRGTRDEFHGIEITSKPSMNCWNKNT